MGAAGRQGTICFCSTREKSSFIAYASAVRPRLAYLQFCNRKWGRKVTGLRYRTTPFGVWVCAQCDETVFDVVEERKRDPTTKLLVGHAQESEPVFDKNVEDMPADIIRTLVPSENIGSG